MVILGWKQFVMIIMMIITIIVMIFMINIIKIWSRILKRQTNHSQKSWQVSNNSPETIHLAPAFESQACFRLKLS